METGVLPARNGVQNGLHAWEPTGPCLVSVGPYMWVPLQFFTFRCVQSEPPAIFQLQLWFSYYRIGSHEGFHFGNGFHFGKLWFFVFSKFRGSILLCGLTSLMDLRRVVDFSVFLLVKKDLFTCYSGMVTPSCSYTEMETRNAITLCFFFS